MQASKKTQITEPNGASAPRKLTVAENAILTIKVLVGLGSIGAVIWGIDVLNGPN